MTRRSAAELATLLFLSLSAAGCGDILYGEENGPPPDPLTPEVVVARVLATKAADDALADAVAALDGAVVGRASSDECYEGQNNYKRREGFDHRCTLRRAVAVGFEGDFRRRIAQLDDRLFAAGWGCYRDPCPETLSSMVDEYWEFRKPEFGGEDPAITTLPTPSMYRKDALFFDTHYALDAKHAIPSGRSWLESAHRRRLGGLRTSYRVVRPLDVEAVVNRGARFAFVVVLAVETTYFEDLDIG